MNNDYVEMRHGMLQHDAFIQHTSESELMARRQYLQRERQKQSEIKKSHGANEQTLVNDINKVKQKLAQLQANLNQEAGTRAYAAKQIASIDSELASLDKQIQQLRDQAASKASQQMSKYKAQNSTVYASGERQRALKAAYQNR